MCERFIQDKAIQCRLCTLGVGISEYEHQVSLLTTLLQSDKIRRNSQQSFCVELSSQNEGNKMFLIITHSIQLPSLLLPRRQGWL